MYEKLIQQIRAERKSQGISQEKLARMVDISKTHMANIEQGKCVASFKILIRILDALNFDLVITKRGWE